MVYRFQICGRYDYSFEKKKNRKKQQQRIKGTNVILRNLI